MLGLVAGEDLEASLALWSPCLQRAWGEVVGCRFLLVRPPTALQSSPGPTSLWASGWFLLVLQALVRVWDSFARGAVSTGGQLVVALVGNLSVETCPLLAAGLRSL